MLQLTFQEEDSRRPLARRRSNRLAFLTAVTTQASSSTFIVLANADRVALLTASAVRSGARRRNSPRSSTAKPVLVVDTVVVNAGVEVVASLEAVGTSGDVELLALAASVSDGDVVEFVASRGPPLVELVVVVSEGSIVAEVVASVDIPLLELIVGVGVVVVVAVTVVSVVVIERDAFVVVTSVVVVVLVVVVIVVVVVNVAVDVIVVVAIPAIVVDAGIVVVVVVVVAVVVVLVVVLEQPCSLNKDA